MDRASPEHFPSAMKVGDIAIHRATTTLRRGRYPDGLDVGIVTLDSAASSRDRWLFCHSLDIMLTHAWDSGFVRIVDVSSTGNAYAVACARGTLRDLPSLGLSLDHRLRIAMQVGETLSGLHASGHVHGCLALHNVLLASNFRPALDEVAMVEPRATFRSAAADPLGYLVFAAPEVSWPGAAAVAGDVYAFGRLLEFLITKEMPVCGVDATDAFRRLQGRASRRVVDVVRWCLAEDPRDRCPTVGACLEQIGGSPCGVL